MRMLCKWPKYQIDFRETINGSAVFKYHAINPFTVGTAVFYPLVYILTLYIRHVLFEFNEHSRINILRILN